MVLLTPTVLSCSASSSSSSFSFPFSKSRTKKNAQYKSREKSHGLYSERGDSNSSLEYLLLSTDQGVIDYQHRSCSRRQSWGLLFRRFTRQSQSNEEKEARAFYLLAATTNGLLGGQSPERNIGSIYKMSGSFPPSSNGHLFGGSTQTGTQNERRRSFGIGGAGNIRRPSDIIYPPRERRRSSVWSGTSGSPEEKKGIFGGWFGFGTGSRSEGGQK
ncbi:hypothetical protein ACMFMG_008512 [Clarireedia jacksonii]